MNTADHQYGDSEFGKRLKRFRLERDLTQADLASPRYTHAYVSTIEAGRRTPSREALEFFASKLGVDLNELETGRPKGMVEELKVKLHEARLAVSQGRLDDGKKVARSVIRTARDYELTRIEARGNELEGLICERQGHLDKAIARYRKAQDLLRGDAPTALAAAVAGEVRCLNDEGDPHHAIFVGENYLDRLQREQMASPAAFLRVRSAMIPAYLRGGSATKAREAADETLRSIPKVNDPFSLATAYVNIAAVQVNEGHYVDAEVALLKAEELFEALDLSYEAGTALLARGIGLASEDKKTEARKALERASSILSETGNVVQHANAEMEIARIDRLDGQAAKASDRLKKALGLLEADSHPRLEAWAHRELGLALSKRDKTEAEKHFNKSLELYELQGVHLEVARTHMMMGKLAGNKDTRGQLRAYEQAMTAMEQVQEV